MLGNARRDRSRSWHVDRNCCRCEVDALRLNRIAPHLSLSVHVRARIIWTQQSYASQAPRPTTSASATHLGIHSSSSPSYILPQFRGALSCTDSLVKPGRDSN